ncbi:hypothetical protein LguiB_004496 [Lonicera macranthoides]
MNSSICGVGLVEALNTRVYGNGTQTLVLSHGFGSDQNVWHYLIPYLACYFKVLVFDLVISPDVNPKLYDPKRYSGFGSYAKDLICVLDELHLENTIYMGHSMSAMIGCIAAAKRPQLFQHLILLGGSPRYLNTKGYIGGFERPVLDTIFTDIQHNFSKWVHNFAPKAIIVNDTSAVSEFEHTFRRIKPKIALSAAKIVFLSDNRCVLSRVNVPCTIIQSEEDMVVPKSVASYMKKKLGGHAKVKILKTKGHYPQLSAYPLLLHVLKKVLKLKG